MRRLSADEGKKRHDTSAPYTEGEFCIDITGKKNGRGAYVCKNPQCLQMAVKNHGLERSFKMSIPKETAVLLEKEMERIAE